MHYRKPRRKGRKEIERLFKETMAENFPNLRKKWTYTFKQLNEFQ